MREGAGIVVVMAWSVSSEAGEGLVWRGLRCGLW